MKDRERWDDHRPDKGTRLIGHHKGRAVQAITAPGFGAGRWCMLMGRNRRMRAMAETYDSPQDCEDAFYDAFEAGDLQAMMACWADDETIACVHPAREEIQGRTAIRESWDQIFRADANMEIEIHHRHWIEAGTMAVHIVHEQLIFNGNRRQSPPPVIATNVYRRDDSGWRLVLHHASPPPPPPAMMRPAGPPPGAITH